MIPSNDLSRNLSAAAVLSFHVQRLGNQSANCKLWTVLIASVCLLFAAGRGAPLILWATAPVAFLGFADAAYAAEARRLSKLALELPTKGASESAAATAALQAQAQGLGIGEALKSLSGLLSFSVWPFYLGLSGLLLGLAHTSVMTMPTTAPAPALRAVSESAPPNFVPRPANLPVFNGPNRYSANGPSGSPIGNGPNLLRPQQPGTLQPFSGAKPSSQVQRPTFNPPSNFRPNSNPPTVSTPAPSPTGSGSVPPSATPPAPPSPTNGPRAPAAAPNPPS